MTRAMLVTVLGRLSGEDIERAKTTSFTDVNVKAWYAPYVSWAEANGIVDTSLTKFRPDDNATREELADMLYRFSISEFKDNDLSNVKLDFTDVAKDKWYYDDVAYVFDKGLMNGISKTEFNPDGNFTRAMFVTVLYRMQKSPSIKTDCPFTDVKDGSYYKDAVIWAYKNEIVNGVSATEFSPDSPITREQMAVIMYRFAKFARMDTKVRGKLANYVDYVKIADYAEDAVLWATKNKVMWSNSEGYFEPKRNATRAEAASVFTVMHRDMR
jgi:hypothetical protein